MLCTKCKTEYEGSRCPKCDGPVILVNNNDYLARRKAYEEKKVRENAEKDKEKEPGKTKKKSSGKMKSIFLNIINSLKSLKKPKLKNTNKKGVKYIVVALVLVLAGLASLGIYKLSTKKNYELFMRSNGKIYNVTGLESKFVCEQSDAIFASDYATFYTPDRPLEVRSGNIVSTLASDSGKYFAADVYDSDSEIYSLYVWDEEGNVVDALNNFNAHEIYCLTDKGQLIYKEIQVINEEGTVGSTSLGMTEVKKSSSKGDKKLAANSVTIESDLKNAYVYSKSASIVFLDNNSNLYRYDFDKKKKDLIDVNIGNLYVMSSDYDYVYGTSVEHINSSDNADSYMYTSDSGCFLVNIKKEESIRVSGALSSGIIYVYDKKNSCMYMINNGNIMVSAYDGERFGQYSTVDSIGSQNNYVFDKSSGELVYINGEGQLKELLKGTSKMLMEGVSDGTLSLINNTEKSLTYIKDGCQYYLKTSASKPVLMYNIGSVSSTSDTCYYKNKLYFYDANNELRSCNLKGKSGNSIGTVERMWLGTELK
ncbi:MAG: hypothetical protein Q4F06_08910 [Eubacteriales bacterium]|nr:hypothetical protein [Eubacteriales bacterium]